MSFDLEVFFKKECGISYSDLKRQNENHIKSLNSEFEVMICETSGHPNGFHPNQINGNNKVFPYNWDKIEELEEEGFGDMLDPWLPAPCERVGKTWLELNIIANERKNLINNKG